MTRQPGPGEVADVLTLDGADRRWFAVSAAVGTVGLLGAAVLALVSEGGRREFLRSYLIAFVFFVSLALGSLFFVLVQHVTRAGWSVLVRRLAETYAANLFFPMSFLAVPLLAGISDLWPWAGVAAAADPIVRAKSAYLNVPFFVARTVAYFAAWSGLAVWYLRCSLRQDVSGDPSLTRRMDRHAGWALVVFALTVTFFSFDFLMSLDPHWFSTIFGVYFFAGCAVGGFALIPLTVAWLQRAGRVSRSITHEHYHDMGKLVFAFVVFWAYIAFSQYMLIWYANLPEETVFYHERQGEGWVGISIFLIVGHFFAPFLALLSRHPKRRPVVLVSAAVWVLFMHAVDLYWVAMPALGMHHPHVGLMDAACFVGVGGWFVALAVRRLAGRALVPVGDPRLAESVRFENV